MSNHKEILSKKVLILIGIISISIFVVGIILLLLGYNEAFYIESSAVQTIFKAITLGADSTFLIILVAILYFIYDKRFAKNLVYSVLLSGYVNTLLKDTFQDPRPPTNVSKEAEYGYIEPGYGFPSGHSQLAVATWGYTAYEFKDKPKPYIVPIILSTFIFLIAISRIIIGVHDLQDIIGGLLIGIGFLIAFIYLEPIFTKKINILSLTMKIILAAVFSTLLFIIGTLLFPTSGLGLVENPPKYSDTGAYAQVGGALLGLTIGYLLENEYINYQPSELKNWQKIINLIIGVIILAGVYVLFDMLIRGTVVHRFIRYAMLSFIMAFFMPLIFTKINRK